MLTLRFNTETALDAISVLINVAQAQCIKPTWGAPVWFREVAQQRVGLLLHGPLPQCI